MNYTISLASLVSIGADMLIGVLVPLILFFLFRKKYKCATKAFLEGSMVAVLISFLLKQIIHGAVLSTGFGAAIMANGWLYGLYSGLVSSLLEESARIYVFKKRLAEFTDNDYNALMFGAGHGGIEAVYLLVVCMISSMQAAIMIYTGNAEVLYYGLEGEAREVAIQAVEKMVSVNPITFLMMAVERCAAILMHISLSVIIWFGVQNTGKDRWKLYGMAVGLHVLLEAVAPVLNQYFESVILVEVAIWLVAIGGAAAATYVWKQEHVEVPANL